MGLRRRWSSRGFGDTGKSGSGGPLSDHLGLLAVDLVRRGVAVIATSGNAAALAAKAATTTIPVVFSVSEDPVRLGLVASLARPGGNCTGINYLIAEVTAKRLELLRALVPGAVQIAVLVNPQAPVTETTLRELEGAAAATGLRMRVLNARSSGEINAAFGTFVLERPDALFVSRPIAETVSGRNLTTSSAQLAVSLLTEKNHPSGSTTTSKRSFDTSIPQKEEHGHLRTPSLLMRARALALFGY